jgi:hypothetical protein
VFKNAALGKTPLSARKTAAFVVAAPSETNATPSFRSITRQISECAIEAMRRELIWVERQNFQGWACSECAWEFKPSGPPIGQSIDEMKMHYQQQRDKEFTSHVCAKHPRATKKLH